MLFFCIIVIVFRWEAKLEREGCRMGKFHEPFLCTPFVPAVGDSRTAVSPTDPVSAEKYKCVYTPKCRILHQSSYCTNNFKMEPYSN